MKTDDVPETWTGRFDFILSCVGLSVGLGSIWRFPFLCYRNGGGAFLIPYVVTNGLLGFPMMFFELAIGQFSSLGPIPVWKICPLFKGNGLASVISSAMVCISYNMIIAYSLYYMVVSLVNLDGKVPWGSCDPAWSTDHCRQEAYPDLRSMDNDTEKIVHAVGSMYSDCVNITFHDNFSPDFNSIYDMNFSTVKANFTHCEMKLVSPSEEYWTRFVLRLHESDGMENIGAVNLKNALCLLLAWIIVFFCLINGIKSSGKVVYFTATFPYFILVVLLIRGVTLPGSYDGILYYIAPNWEKVITTKAWVDAAVQNFYALSLANGSMMNISSYNKFSNNCFRDASIAVTASCIGSIFAGFPVFALLGFMAHQTHQSVEDVAESGPGLAFVAYPEGIARMPEASLWAFLTYSMIFFLGITSQVILVGNVITGFTDLFPDVLRPRKRGFTFVCCIVGFVLGIPQTTKGGLYVLTLLDWHTASNNVLMIACCELVAVTWIYGFRNFIQDVEMMIGVKRRFFWTYWKITWIAVAPMVLLFLIVMSAVYNSPVSYGDYQFPGWAQGVGWTLTCFPMALILGGIVLQSVRKGGIRKATTPEGWRPRLPENRFGRYLEITDHDQNHNDQLKKNTTNSSHVGDLNDDETHL